MFVQESYTVTIPYKDVISLEHNHVYKVSFAIAHEVQRCMTYQACIATRNHLLWFWKKVMEGISWHSNRSFKMTIHCESAQRIALWSHECLERIHMSLFTEVLSIAVSVYGVFEKSLICLCPHNVWMSNDGTVNIKGTYFHINNSTL